MIAISEIVPRPAVLLAGIASIAIAGALFSMFVLTPPTPETRTVVKVCRDGSLVLRTGDGDFEVVRPGAYRGWPAVGPEVCDGRN